ncbi:hypothetical protein FB45DRAFT_989651 [Roridomyces roridus]|uniref:C2H2-type domain-containing protein n=1 Tax=Roridomyces roridus TaxID=1738132 RepID=A0AAD7BZQ1_9AGAR|nr:hypothetical protein FB45DRAFT_989651 [Roridomyces roridus]
MPHGVSYTCPDCLKPCKSLGGLTQHHNRAHRKLTPASDGEDENTFQTVYHPQLTARPCNAHGAFLPEFVGPPRAPPPPPDGQDPAAWEPFGDRAEFDFANFHFTEAQSSEKDINIALDIWAASVLKYGATAPWRDARELYATIDTIHDGQAPWKTYTLRYSGPLPPGQPPKWMTQTYELCTHDTRVLLHNQLSTTVFRDHVNLVPYRQFNHTGKRVYSNLMSGDWAWKQADEIGQDPQTHGSAFVPVVAGSDKTTVSVGTGHQEFHPIYISPGVLTGTARRAHGNGVLPAAFLPIPKTSKKHRSRPAYQKFVRQMYHACLARVFQPLKAAMTIPDIVQCPDRHFRRVIISLLTSDDLRPYIADYPEQVWLAAVVQGWCAKCDAEPGNLDRTGSRLRTKTTTEFLVTQFDPGILWDDFGIRADVVPFTTHFPRADIHELLSSDLLHQVIKGTFKDHLVSWVNDYLHITHGEKRALEIIQDIDRRISAVSEFPGLRRFPDGRDFHQWTGDDSKALMKVYLAAVAGYLPSDMVKCLAAFMDTCYLVRRNSISADDLDIIRATLDRFHHYRKVFIETGVRVDISLPRQHSLLHYIRSIRLFGSPNGLCSSITESKHIKAVKEPWRRSSRFNALPQMLRSISRLEKLAAAAVSFCARGMLIGTTSSYTAMVLDGYQPQVVAAAVVNAADDDEDEVNHSPKCLTSVELGRVPARGYPKDLHSLAAHIEQPLFPAVFRRFLYEELHGPVDDVALDDCPVFGSHIKVFHSAIARFYAPSDLCGAGGMYSELIRANPNWHGYARHDTVFVAVGGPAMAGLVVGRVLLFFAFHYAGKDYQCALVHWFVPVGDTPDPDTGMWVVKPEVQRREPSLAIVPVQCIARAAHLIGVCGTSALPEDFHFSDTLDAFNRYFVNPYADHHMYEFLK